MTLLGKSQFYQKCCRPNRYSGGCSRIAKTYYPGTNKYSRNCNIFHCFSYYSLIISCFTSKTCFGVLSRSCNTIWLVVFMMPSWDKTTLSCPTRKFCSSGLSPEPFKSNFAVPFSKWTCVALLSSVLWNSSQNLFYKNLLNLILLIITNMPFLFLPSD